MELEAMVKSFDDKLLEIKASQKFNWVLPTDTDLRIFKKQYKNTYGYALETCEDLDLFGENKFNVKIKGKGDNELLIGENGQLNLTTTKKPIKTKEMAAVDEFIAK